MNNFLQKLKKHGTAVAFIAGFIWDNIMLDRIDHGFANFMLGSYLFLSAVSIIILNMRGKNRAEAGGAEKFSIWLAYILQFSLGSLFSAYIILYGRSASLSANWPFLALLALLVAANELLRKKYFYIVVQLSALFIVLFSYAIFSLPVLVGKIGEGMFIASGLASLFVMWLIALVIGKTSPEMFKKEKIPLAFSVAGIYLLFNIAYFTNIIPPVPLALKEIGVYHSVTRTEEGKYAVSYEKSPWYEWWRRTDNLFRRKPGESVYVLSSVFAPTKIRTPIFHQWQYFDEDKKSWVKSDKIQFSIQGGRDGGFRGYSLKTGVFPGKWRVEVLSARGQLIGRINFEVTEGGAPKNLNSEII